MSEERRADVWPFHESIVHALEEQDDLDFEVLMWLICHTVIPAGHERIITALQRAIGGLIDIYQLEFNTAKAHILNEKRIADEKAAKKVMEKDHREESEADSVVVATQVFQGMNK